MVLNIMSQASNTLSVGEETDSVVGVRTSIRLEQARTSGSFQVLSPIESSPTLTSIVHQ